MKTETQNYLIAWAKDKTKEEQNALAKVLEKAQKQNEEITLSLIKQKIAEIEASQKLNKFWGTL